MATTAISAATDAAKTRWPRSLSVRGRRVEISSQRSGDGFRSI